MTESTFLLNGQRVRADVPARTSLGDFIRIEHGLTAVHLACEHGVCGACTVFIDGAPARSCIAFAAQVDGSDVRTLEGFAGDPLMDALRRAFNVEHGLQCGYCTPGMLVTARDIVTRLAVADERRIRTELAGNLCRCTGYVGIVKAIQRVMREISADERLRQTVPGRAPFERRIAAQSVGMHQQPVSSNVRPLDSTIRSSDPSLSEEMLRRLEAVSPIEVDFIVRQQPADTWRILSRTEQVASCLPGFEMLSLEGDRVSGRLHLAFGSIRAAFLVRGQIERNDELACGSVSGLGEDERSRTRAHGRLRYEVSAVEGDDFASRVAVSLRFVLQGPLAHFARGSLVREFTSRLVGAFAANLDALASGRDHRRGRASAVGIGAIARHMVVDRLARSWLGRVWRFLGKRLQG